MYDRIGGSDCRHRGFHLEGQEKIVMDWIAEKGYHTGNVMNAFRLTLVGEGKGPHMFDISWVLGKEETLARMKRAVEALNEVIVFILNP